MSLRNLTSYFFVCILILTSCSSNSSSNSEDNYANTDTGKIHLQNKNSVNTIIDIRQIADKTLTEVEKILGKAERIENVKGYPCKNSNCQRAFFKNEKYEIIFKSAKADRITINNVLDFTSNDDAIQALNLPASAPSFKNPGNVIKWIEFEGINEISFFPDYVLIQITKPE